MGRMLLLSVVRTSSNLILCILIAIRSSPRSLMEPYDTDTLSSKWLDLSWKMVHISKPQRAEWSPIDHFPGLDLAQCGSTDFSLGMIVHLPFRTNHQTCPVTCIDPMSMDYTLAIGEKIVFAAPTSRS
ncbi:uncharacterized protein EV420DRAFT_1611297 [Desarmillaria tabescens]|uniref:Uncharacterized protein n=1 Tax=Armillaria tabescens TaxID=1929756 RepID=A0AA39IVM0_ARMTA|nr:uncharacterized protein EV420DRAFT_1611297 [Desarmillaria tabescens]KAK0431302.1 hypothetical protein EV420DRAFT_1611297 [Desarmillaria tabescens]